MRLSIIAVLALTATACVPSGDLFGSSSAGSGGRAVSSSASSGSGGASSSSSGASSSSASSSSADSSSSTSGGGLYWASGVQTDVPLSMMTGWQECYAGLYSDTSVKQTAILAACQGSKLALACRPKGAQFLSVVAMDQRNDATFLTDINDVKSQHLGSNGVNWYFSPYQWGFLPAGDQRQGSCDTTGISPNAPGPDGDKRLCWYGNNGQMWVGYRCGYLCYENTPGFDYAYERVVFSAP